MTAVWTRLESIAIWFAECVLGYERTTRLLHNCRCIPAYWFVGVRIRFLLREGDHHRLEEYLLTLTERNIEKIAFKMSLIVSAWSCLERPPTRLSLKLTELKRILISRQLHSIKSRKKRIDQLIKCFELNLAKEFFEDSAELFDDRYSVGMNEYFEFIFNCFPQGSGIFEDVIERSVESLSTNGYGQKLVYFLPPAISQVHVGSDASPDFYKQTVILYSTVYHQFINNNIDFLLLYQFNWRHVSLRLAGERSISYHTAGVDKGRVHIKESPLANYFTIDSFGYSGWSSVSRACSDDIEENTKSLSHSKIEEIHEKLYHEFVRCNYSKYDQPKVANSVLTGRKGYVLLCLQVVTDPVAQLAYIDVVSLLKYMVKLAKREKFELVIKRHPKCRSKYIERFLKRAEEVRNITITVDSIHRLVANCKTVVTVNSGVGMEALIHLKPVVCSGRTEYASVCTIVKNKRELQAAVESNICVDRDLTKKFLAYYYTFCVARFDDHSQINYLVNSELKIGVNSYAD